ncbi:hypothetical protein DPMN_024105 [Dreissena polymorpha]|uniref:KY-like immunoglobulin-like domain-containing protein n=1 Tax=Dreissena polymorpha TaxID=45954 RepID=A0A9D4LP53_DREPO|nr:hypothetical protein DPMN_024105 [Dreissena polymorpha]
MMSESMKWQLLKNPISLGDFNNNVQLKARAFALDVTPVSQKRRYIAIKDEIELTFKSQHRLQYSAKLPHFDGNWIREKQSAQSKSCIGIITVHPPIAGKYSLDIFAKHITDEGPLDQVAVYNIQCNDVKDSTFEFPMVYASDYTDQCDIMQPRNARLPDNSDVVFEIKAPHVKNVSVNTEMLKSNGGTFRGKIKANDKGLTYTVNAIFHKGSIIHFTGMFQFYTV